MDSGIYVLAAAEGVVTFIEDNLFDREKQSVIEKGLGNLVVIDHQNGYVSYYAHLKKNSVMVKVGDTVKAQTRIAQIGSSGNSTDAHLHFELWYDSSILVDPFEGDCGNAASLWKEPIPYDTSHAIWTSGLSNYILNLDTVREEPNNQVVFSENDEAISYWSIMRGVRKNDSLKLKWFNPDDLLWFQFDYKAPQDFWYFYFWSNINAPKADKKGNWKVRLYLNERIVDEKLFTVISTASIQAINGNDNHLVYPNPNKGIFFVTHPNTANYDLYHFDGRKVEDFLCESGRCAIQSPVVPGLYFLKSMDSGLYVKISIEP
jgi:hypothetical protein